MYCKACGYLLYENDQICKKCGTAVFSPFDISYKMNEVKHAEVNKSIMNNTGKSAGEEAEFKWNVHEFPHKKRVTEDVDFDWSLKGDRPDTSRKTRVFKRKTKETELVLTEEPTVVSSVYSWEKPQETETADVLDSLTQEKSELEHQANETAETGDLLTDFNIGPEYQAKEIADARDLIVDESSEPELQAKKTADILDLPIDTEIEPEFQAKETADVRNDLLVDTKIEPEYQIKEMTDAGDSIVNKNTAPEYPEEEAADVSNPPMTELHSEIEAKDPLLQDLQSWESSKSDWDSGRDRFFTFNKKNEEFQKLLDNEYQRIQNYNNPRLRATDLFTDLNKADEEHDFSFIIGPSDKGSADKMVDSESIIVDGISIEDIPRRADQPEDSAAVLSDDVTARSEQDETRESGIDWLDDLAQPLDSGTNQASAISDFKVTNTETDWLSELSRPTENNTDQTILPDDAEIAAKSEIEIPSGEKEDTAKNDSSPGSDKSDKKVAKKSRWRKTARLTAEISTFEETFAALEREKEKLEKKEQSQKSIGGFVLIILIVILVIVVGLFLIWKFAPNSIGAYFINTGIDSIRRFLTNT